MADSRKDGGLAFGGKRIEANPFHTAEFPEAPTWIEVTHDGMSLRDYFAAKAMAAFVASGAIANIVAAQQIPANDAPPFLAAGSYALADAMLAERAK